MSPQARAKQVQEGQRPAARPSPSSGDVCRARHQTNRDFLRTSRKTPRETRQARGAEQNPWTRAFPAALGWGWGSPPCSPETASALTEQGRLHPAPLGSYKGNKLKEEREGDGGRLLGCCARPVLQPFSEHFQKQCLPCPLGLVVPCLGKIFQLGSWQSHRAAETK